MRHSAFLWVEGYDFHETLKNTTLLKRDLKEEKTDKY